jgi:hypothetical protein
MEAYNSCYQRNVEQMKLRESSVRGIEFDPNGAFVATCTDFGYLTTYDLCNLDDKQSPISSRTINYNNLPFYSSVSNSDMLFW